MKASKHHPNKNIHNWLIYNINDKFLDEYSKFIKGDLYDLGCGEAPYKEYFLQFSDKYIGVDWTSTIHNSKADVVSDLNKKIRLDDDCATTLISLSVLEHLNEPQQFLNESYRILKKDGYFILQVPWQWHIHEAPYDYFRYTPYGLKYLFNKAGFKDIKIVPQSGFFSARVLKFNYFTVRLIYKLPRYIMYPLAALICPLWIIGQVISPYLDKLDNDWDRETVGFIVVAHK